MHRANVPTLHTRRLQAIAILMYKLKNGLAPKLHCGLICRYEFSVSSSKS